MLKNTVSKEDCCGCSACYKICPKNCIEMRADEEGFLYPEIDKSICIECGRCEAVCQFNKTKRADRGMPAYGARNLNNEVRENSSSGGIFSLIASNVLDADGVVFGSELTEDCKSAKHTKIDNASQLSRLRGSKYFQSEIADTYSQIEIELKRGKQVLFSGTPCQIAGLYACLKKSYDNLITVEVVCHGVPSPLLWKRYADYLEEKFGQRIVQAYFRNKKDGWKRFGMKVVFADGKTIHSDLNHDTFLQFFLNNFSLRPSCFNCHTKCVGDIVLGDYWGAEHLVPEMDDDRGLSLILLNSEKGKKIFEEIKDSIVCFETNFEEVLPYNISLVSPVEKDEYRDNFFQDLRELSFDELIRKYEAIIQKKNYIKKKGNVEYYLKRSIIACMELLGLRRKRRKS